MKETRLALEDELDTKIAKAIEDAGGSGWTIYQFHKMYITLCTEKTSRTGSYIKTPETYNYPKCGLINIKNEDDECFKHCTTYHQIIYKQYDQNSTTRIIVIMYHIRQV